MSLYFDLVYKIKILDMNIIKKTILLLYVIEYLKIY